MNTPRDPSSHPSPQRPASGTPSDTGAVDRIGDRAEDLAGQVRAEGQEQVQHYRNVAADKVDTLADSIEAAAAELQGDDDVAQLSGHIADMASGLGRLADGLREKSTDQILRDVRQVARENPTLFIAGSVAIGFAITRFARASAPADTGQPEAASTQSQRARARSADNSRWTHAESAVGGTPARRASSDDTLGSATSGSPGDVAPAMADPSAPVDAISARAGAAASDTDADERSTPSPTDGFGERSQP
jgi:hypothetical protein